MKKFVIDQGSGRLGNQMMQLMTAKQMVRLLSDFEVYGYDMPAWQLFRPVTVGVPYCPLLVRGAAAPLDLVLRLCRLGLVKAVAMRSVCPVYHRFLPREEAQQLFQPRPDDDTEGFDETHIVIHIRAEDILLGKAGDYGPVPFEYYRMILRETGLKPVFVGQLANDYYSNLLKTAFPDALFVQPQTPIKDFQRIRNSKNIVLSLSTFAWLAAWLSDAQRIYMPLIGGWNPAQRPDIDLTPPDDPRFVYDLFPVRIWKASPEQIASLAHDRTFRRVTVAEIDSMRRRARLKLLPKRVRKAMQLLLYLALHLIGRGVT